ncbi:hypothetical protein RFI_18859, partial [Reticulomyxa filosa]
DLLDKGWDPSTWQALIYEKQLLPCLADVPSPKQLTKARLVNDRDIKDLEDLWMSDPSKTWDDLILWNQRQLVQSVSSSYASTQHYSDAYLPLIELEEEADRNECIFQVLFYLKKKKKRKRGTILCYSIYILYIYRLEGMPVEWRLSQVQKTQMARFVLPTTRMNIDWDVRPGMQNWKKAGPKTGVVHDVKHDCEVTLIFKEGTVDFKEGLNEPEPEPFPTDITTGFDIEVVWIGVPYKRMREAVQKLVTDEFAMTEYLLHTLLGNEVKVEKSEYSSNEIKYSFDYIFYIFYLYSVYMYVYVYVYMYILI